jgi:hypothetical protein
MLPVDFESQIQDSNAIRRRLTLLIVGLIFIADCFGQDGLLFKKNDRRSAYYYADDFITFRIKGHPSKITDRISGFEDSLIVFRFYKVNPTEITHLYVDKKTRVWFAVRYKYEKVLPVVGAGYILLNWLNSGTVSESDAIMGGSLITAGLLAKIFISKKMKIRGKRKLRILNLESS